MTQALDYNNFMQEAAKANDHQQEVGDTWNEVSKKWIEILNKCQIKAFGAGWKTYYIWILIGKDPNVVNSLKIWPFCRKTRPSPYQAFDHFCWKVSPKSGLSFEWSVPSLATSEYVLANPDKFPPEYVHTLKRWRAGTLV